jgi:CO dehydrogenase/acetyl-CoA synthase alpha subunit
MDSNNREKTEEKKNICQFCGRDEKDCPRCVQIKEYLRVELSDDDFVDKKAWLARRLGEIKKSG